MGKLLPNIVIDITPGHTRGDWMVFDFLPADLMNGSLNHRGSDWSSRYLPSLIDSDHEFPDQVGRAKTANPRGNLGRYHTFTLEYPLYNTHFPVNRNSCVWSSGRKEHDEACRTE